MKNASWKNDITPLVKLAVPLAMTGLIQSLTWFFETVFLAQLGTDILAAGALVSWLCATLLVILYGTFSSINILVAHRHGAKESEKIGLIARDGLLLAMLIVPLSLILFWNMSSLFILFGQTEKIVTLADAYLHALSWGLLATFLAMACLEVLIGVGYARLILVFSMITVALNIGFSYVLIFGKWGFPALGIAGAGWGLTISAWGSFIILIITILWNEKYRQYFRSIVNFTKPSYLWELVQIGFPMGLMYCVEVGFFFVLTLIMGTFNTQTQAANQFVLQYLGLAMSIIFAVAQAITVRVGHLLGANDIDAAKRSANIGVVFSVLFICILAISYWSFPLTLISVAFNVSDPANKEIIIEITRFLAICALFQIVETARITMFGVLRALKDTRFTLIASIISFWCIALPVGYLLATYTQLGSSGYWWAMVIGASASVILLRWRFNIKIRAYSGSI